jgi:type VI protein secretion system component Hcp
MSMFLDIQTPAIAGESTSPNPNWNAKSRSSISPTTCPEHVAGNGTGLVSSGSRVGHIHVTKVMDKSSPMLFAQLCAGKPLEL